MSLLHEKFRGVNHLLPLQKAYRVFDGMRPSRSLHNPILRNFVGRENSLDIPLFLSLQFLKQLAPLSIAGLYRWISPKSKRVGCRSSSQRYLWLGSPSQRLPRLGLDLLPGKRVKKYAFLARKIASLLKDIYLFMVETPRSYTAAVLGSLRVLGGAARLTFAS